MDFRKDLIRTFYPSMPNRINNTTTNFDAWLSQPENIATVSEDITPEKTMAEHIIDYYISTVLPSNSVNDTTWKQNSALYIRKDLEYLNRKLSVVRKTITAWDTYKVVEVVTEPELLGAKIQGLPLNSSLIVNTPTSVLLNNNNYSMGDIVFKDINGIIHRLQSQPSGFFYPSNIKSTQQGTPNTVQITYSFASGSQPYIPEAEITGDPLTEPAQSIQATINMEKDSLPYNQSFILTKNTNPSKNNITYHSNPGIPPKIFAYIMSDEAKGEEIYIDQDQLWAVSGEEGAQTITVTNNTSFEKLYITMR